MKLFVRSINILLLFLFKGVLLHGPPGCGKTLIAKATAKEAGARFINLDVSILTDKWYGESQKLAAAVFSLAIELQPCIIFIDEIGEIFIFSYSNKKSSFCVQYLQIKIKLMAYTYYIFVPPFDLKIVWYATGVLLLFNALHNSDFFADSFLRARSSQDHEATAMMKAQFMSLWDGLITDPNCVVIVMGATNRPRDLDQAILRRMPSMFHIGLPVSVF